MGDLRYCFEITQLLSLQTISNLSKRHKAPQLPGASDNHVGALCLIFAETLSSLYPQNYSLRKREVYEWLWKG